MSNISSNNTINDIKDEDCTMPCTPPTKKTPPLPMKYPHSAYTNKDMILEIAHSMTMDLEVNSYDELYHVIELSGR